MRLATGFLIALVAYLWLGLADAASPPGPQAGACPTACNKTTACSKATACSTATGCNKATATACAAKASCDKASACQGQPCCDETASKDAVMAAMFGKMVIGNEGAKCSKSMAGANSPACATASACESAAGCETACATKKACCEAAAACNETAACATATACKSAACPATGESPQVIATDTASACESGNCCKAKRSPAVADSSEAPCARCAKLTVASDETYGSESSSYAGDCNQSSACASDACPSGGSPSAVQLTHLMKAAEHLAAAGLMDEADCVRAMAVEVRQKLVAKKVAQIASLQAEIAALGGGEGAGNEVAARCEQRPAQSVSEWMNTRPASTASKKSNKQVALNVKHVEVSLSKMKQLGFAMDVMGSNGWKKADSMSAAFSQNQPSAFLRFLKALEREQVAKVLSWPTVVVADGGSFEVNNREHGMHLDVQARFLDDKHVQVNIRPRVGTPGEQTLEMNADVELELGKTAVLGGLVQERLVVEKDSNSQDSRMVRTEVQHLILVTPELVEPATAVTAASHDEPSVQESQRGERRARAIPVFGHTPGEPQPRVRYSFPAQTR